MIRASIALLVVAIPTLAAAQSPEDFYKGKTVDL